MKFGIGASVTRIEDPALITGQGQFTSDLVPEDALHMVAVRSPVAHARFTIENADEVAAMPGVKAVLTYDDVAHLGGLPTLRPIPNSDGSPSILPFHPILQENTVRYVGDTLAAIIADSKDAARSAAEALYVDYEELDHVVDMKDALADDAPQLWPQLPGNVGIDYEHGDKDAVEEAFAKAAHVTKIDLVNNRVVTNYMEPRAAFGEIDEKGRYKLTTGSQGVHLMLPVLAQMIFKEPEENFHIVTPDVGGGFGTRFFVYREYALVLLAAKKLGQPVYWIADRTDHFMVDYHGRDQETHAEMAFDEKGKILALKADTLANFGAYVSQLAHFVPIIGALMLPGCYRVPAIHIRVRGVMTNMVSCDAYRGAGRPEASYIIERFIDKSARDIGIKPDVIRRRNFIPPSAMPHTTKTDRIYDSGEFKAHMDQAMELIDWKGFNKRVRSSKKAGKLRGLGLATYIEACSGGGPETAAVQLDQDGGASVFIGTQASGQGHKTAYAQLVNGQLGIAIDKIRVIQGDSDLVKGWGTGGSRSVPVGGASLNFASERLAERIKTLAADELEAAPSDIELDEGSARIAGTDREVSLSLVAEKANAAGILDDLREEESWTPPHFTFPNGTHAVEVEVDPDTGHIEILDYVVVDDFGVTMNPILLLGQIHGGIAQGLGQAVLERVVYDRESGQLITASLQDYCLPRADDFPDITFETRNVRCTTNALGMKGAGEAGAIGACPAVVNAVVDALERHNGLTHIDMPMTPERVWRAANGL